MVNTLLANRKRSFRRSCPSLSPLSHGISCCKYNCYLASGYKNIKKSLTVTLDPCKRYPLPLPKSVPHLPRTFFTELCLNRVVNQESKFSAQKEVIRCENTVEIVKNKLILEGFKSGKSPLGKPKIPAPDFKLRETRPTVANRAVKNVLSYQQKPQPNLETINILIDNKPSNEKPVLEKKNSAKIDKNRRKHINKIFNAKHLGVVSESYQNPFCSPEKFSVCNEIKRNSSSIKRPHQKKLNNNTPIHQSGITILRSESGDDHFLQNIKNVQGSRSKAESHFLYKETNNSNKLSICNFNSIFYWDKKFDKNCKENIESKTLFAHAHSKDLSILHDRNNNLLETEDKTSLKLDSYLQSNVVTKHVLPIMQDDWQIPQTPPPSLDEIENKTKSDGCCSCSTDKDKAGRYKWNFFHYTNISESLFFGPTLDETIMNLIYCMRQIFEKIGILTPKEKNMGSCCGCKEKSETINPSDILDNHQDVVKWLHDEYLGLAKDVAEANAALEHNCPCTKDNCPVELQSRRYVLDRLAELLEKKQEIESAYRKKQNDKKIKKT